VIAGRAWEDATGRETGARGAVLLLALVGVVSIVFGALLVLTGGLSLVALIAWVIAGLIIARPRLGVYTMLGLVVLFEAGGPDPLMAFGAYLHGGLTGTAGLAGFVATPLELLLLLMLGSCIFQACVRERRIIGGIELGASVAVFATALVFGLLRGAASGGDMYIALFESRYLFYVPLCFLATVLTITDRAHLRTLVGLTLVANGLFALEGAYRRVALIDTGALGVIREFTYQHEDVVFLASALVATFGAVALKIDARLRVIALVTAPVVLYTLLASERRAGIIALIVGLLGLSLVLLFQRPRAFFGLAIPLFIAGGLFMAVTWNTPGVAGQPARAVRSLSEPDRRDASSNIARVLETQNVAATIAADPVLGVGFGREYSFVVPVPDLSWWPLWHYVSHNNILWLWLKLGIVGFVAFWALMGGALARSVRWMRASHPTDRAVGLMAFGAITATLVFSYVDIALASGRVPVFLGIVLGALGVLSRTSQNDLEVSRQ